MAKNDEKVNSIAIAFIIIVVLFISVLFRIYELFSDGERTYRQKLVRNKDSGQWELVD